MAPPPPSDVSESQTVDRVDEKKADDGPPPLEKGEGEDEGEEESSSAGAFDPVTGKINWDCPCLGGMAHGPCGMQFRDAFSCFVFSEEEPKGMDCVEKFKAMQDCFRENPDVYGEGTHATYARMHHNKDVTIVLCWCWLGGTHQLTMIFFFFLVQIEILSDDDDDDDEDGVSPAPPPPSPSLPPPPSSRDATPASSAAPPAESPS